MCLHTLRAMLLRRHRSCVAICCCEIAVAMIPGHVGLTDGCSSGQDHDAVHLG